MTGLRAATFVKDHLPSNIFAALQACTKKKVRAVLTVSCCRHSTLPCGSNQHTRPLSSFVHGLVAPQLTSSFVKKALTQAFAKTDTESQAVRRRRVRGRCLYHGCHHT